MPLLNYTTSVAVSRSIGQIQGLLVEAGARKIGTEYDDVGNVSAIAFSVETVQGPRGFTLPIHAECVLSVLKRQKVPARYQTPEHAERVAWRIVKDWLEAQLAIIHTEMVTLEQVMLPYMHTADGTTIYELYLKQQLALPAGSS